MARSGILNAACKSPALGETFAGGTIWERAARVIQRSTSGPSIGLKDYFRF